MSFLSPSETLEIRDRAIQKLQSPLEIEKQESVSKPIETESQTTSQQKQKQVRRFLQSDRVLSGPFGALVPENIGQNSDTTGDRSFPSSKSSRLKKRIPPLFVLDKNSTKNKQTKSTSQIPSSIIPSLFRKCVPSEQLTAKESQVKSDFLKDFLMCSPFQLKFLISSLLVGDSINQRQSLTPSTLAFSALILTDKVESGGKARLEIQELTSDNKTTRDKRLQQIQKEADEIFQKEEGNWDKKKIISEVEYKMVIGEENEELQRVQPTPIPHPGFIVGVWCLDSDTFSEIQSPLSSDEERERDFNKTLSDKKENLQSTQTLPSNAQGQILKNFPDKTKINFLYYATSFFCTTFLTIDSKGEPVFDLRWKICLSPRSYREQENDKNTQYFGIPEQPKSKVTSNLDRKKKIISTKTFGVKLLSRNDFIYVNPLSHFSVTSLSANTLPIENLQISFESLSQQLDDLYLQERKLAEATARKLRQIQRNFMRNQQRKGLFAEIDAIQSCELYKIAEAKNKGTGEEGKQKMIRCLLDQLQRSPYVQKLAQIQAVRKKKSLSGNWIDAMADLSVLVPSFIQAPKFKNAENIIQGTKPKTLP